MQNAKKANHEATRAYLELWQCSCGPDIGVWSLQLDGLERGKSIAPIFEKANLKPKSKNYRSPIRFAIEDYLYVPLSEGGIRDDSLENSFADYETQMIDLCRAAKNGTSGGMKASNIIKGLLGCLTHAIRDSFGWDSLHSLFQNSVVANNASEFEPKTHQGLVKNAYRFIAEYEALIPTWEWTVFWNLPGSLLISDRPCWDMRLTKFKENIIFMPLSPNTLLMGNPITDATVSAGNLSFIDANLASKEFIDRWNDMTIERARRWLVGNSVVGLNAVLPQLTQEKFANRLSGDTLQIRHLE